MVTEIYKDIKGYEGLYQVSNMGNVKSIRNDIVLQKNKKRTGYFEVSLSKDGVQRYFLVHRLVASNFINNDNNYPQVNHINGDKTDNRDINLEWVTVSLNTKHAYENNLSGFRDKANLALSKINEKFSYNKIIFIKGNEIIEFKSVSSAADMLGLKRDNITRAIRKKQKVGGWQVFGYKNANEETLTSKEEGNLVGMLTNE